MKQNNSYEKLFSIGNLGMGKYEIKKSNIWAKNVKLDKAEEKISELHYETE